MKLIISPAKKLNLGVPSPWSSLSRPHFFDRTVEIIRVMKEYDIPSLMSLMGISRSLAELNYKRFQSFETTWSEESSESSLFLFQGDTYKGLDAASFSEADLSYAKDYLHILSGLYGVLAPDDGIQPYRLEMGRSLAVGQAKNLTEYWSQSLADVLLTGSEYLLNCASVEYFAPLGRALSATQSHAPHCTVIHVDFKEYVDGDEGMLSSYRTIGILAKKARGRMARFVIMNRINHPRELTDFSEDGYGYHSRFSSPDHLVFTRKKVRS